MSSGNAVVSFNHVRKQYKLFKNDRQRFLSLFIPGIKPLIKEAVNDVSFTIEKGESVAFFGSNGAGKSTMLKMITGVVYPTEGEVTVKGRVSALLELTAGFEPDFTGRENIFLRGELMGVPRAEIEAMAPAIIDFADIGDYIDQPVRAYSSGMKARLGFAINVNIAPEILIVDEALSVGEKAFKAKCNARVSEILSGGDVTFLFVTHSPEDARKFCKRGIVLKEGKIVYDSDVDSAARYYEEMSS